MQILLQILNIRLRLWGLDDLDAVFFSRQISNLGLFLC